MKAVGEWIVCKQVKTEKVGKLFLPVDRELIEFEVTSVGTKVDIDVEPGNKIMFFTKNAVEHEGTVLVHQKDVFAITG